MTKTTTIIPQTTIKSIIAIIRTTNVMTKMKMRNSLMFQKPKCSPNVSKSEMFSNTRSRPLVDRRGKQTD